jgi:hypothetical protein
MLRYSRAHVFEKATVNIMSLLSTESCLPRCTTRRGPKPRLHLRLGRLGRWCPSIIAGVISSVSKIHLSALAFHKLVVCSMYANCCIILREFS